MSASIPIPGRRHEGQNPPNPLQMQIGAMSLPVAHHAFGKSPAKHRPLPLISQDDIATSWPPRPSVRLVSRSARKWVTGHGDVNDLIGPHRKSPFEPWDFSEIASTSTEVASAFQKGTARAERPPREGVCGTYFIRRVESKNSVLCVFKPVDEEAGDLERSPQVSHGFGRNSGDLFSHHGHDSWHNSESLSDYSPSPPAAHASLGLGHGSRSRKSDPGFLAGEGAYKEVAAYLLDHDRFARVPQTALAMCNFTSGLPERNKPTFEELTRSPSSGFGDDTSSSSDEEDDNTMRTKMGAFQVYVENSGDADDYGPGVFSKDQIHKIAVLDIRTLNHDRHGGNILVVKSNNPGGRFNLVPIDHGYILPDVVQSVPWPVWMDWSPIKEEICPEVKAYIARLDPAAEARSLSAELDGKLRMGSLRALRIATTLLQKGVAAGLTLYEVGLLIYSRRDFPNVKSELERIIVEAENAADTREHRFSEELLSAETSTDSGNTQETNGFRSSGYFPSPPEKRVENQMLMDDYIVKYASRLISQTVRRVADNKAGAGGGVMNSSKPLGRARSIPDFGIGFRPLHALTDVFPRLATEDHIGPTPVSSPVDKDRGNHIENLVSSFAPPSKPIRFSIDLGTGPISLPPLPRNPGGVPQSTDSIPNLKSSRPIHRRNASERPSGRPSGHKVGSLEATAMGPHLPGLFKSPVSPRKSSPVGPLDTMYWGDEDTDAHSRQFDR